MESDKDLALRIIHDGKLGHPDLPLVERFLHDAKDGDKAAKYLLQACKDDATGVKFSRFVEDWKALVKLFYVENPSSGYLDNAVRRAIASRDGHRCCISGIRAHFWNSCAVFPIIPLAAFFLREVGPTSPIDHTLLRGMNSLQERLSDMLGAFTTASQRDLLLHSSGQSSRNVIQNHWTLSRQVAKVFSIGEMRLEHMGGTEYDILYNDIGGNAPKFFTSKRLLDWQCDLSDRSNSNINSPNPELLEIHCRLSRALRWTDISAKMKHHKKPRQPRKTLPSSTNFIASSLLLVWLKFPESIRLRAYKLLKTAGSYLYEPSATMGVQRLPFGMYLKYGPEYHSDRHTREFNALQLVCSHTSIPVPRPIDLIQTAKDSVMVTSRIDGERAGVEIDTCSDEEMSLMVEDLRGWIAELHSIRRPVDSKYAICGILGGACLDYRISSEPAGPFHDERELSESLRLGILPNLVHRDNHKIVLAHGDLNMRNILVKDGRISGIVDWENAGWYPEYWEYTKCYFGVRLHKRWLRMIDEVFGNQYQEELEIERQYWVYHSPW